MKISKQKVIINHSAKEIYEIVLDIKKYPEFIPWCSDVNIISKTGNCVAASLPLALAIACEKKKIKRDDYVYLIGTGAGLSIASIILRY